MAIETHGLMIATEIPSNTETCSTFASLHSVDQQGAANWSAYDPRVLFVELSGTNKGSVMLTIYKDGVKYDSKAWSMNEVAQRDGVLVTSGESMSTILSSGLSALPAGTYTREVTISGKITSAKALHLGSCSGNGAATFSGPAPEATAGADSWGTATTGTPSCNW